MILTKTATKKQTKRKTYEKKGIMAQSTRLLDSEKRQNIVDIGETVVTPYFESKNHIGCKMEATVLEDRPNGYVLALRNGRSVRRTEDEMFRVSPIRLKEGCSVDMLEFDDKAGNVRGYWEATFLQLCEVPGQGTHVVVQWKNEYDNSEGCVVRPIDTVFSCNPISQKKGEQLSQKKGEQLGQEKISLKKEGWSTLSLVEKKALVVTVLKDMAKLDGWSFDDSMWRKFTQWNEFNHIDYKDEAEAYVRDNDTAKWCLLKSFSAGFNKAYSRRYIPRFSVVSVGPGNGDDLLSVTQLITDSRIHWIYAFPLVNADAKIIVGASNVALK